MNAKQISLMAVAMLTLLTSCSDDSNEPKASSKYITVSTQIGAMTRVSTAQDGAQQFDDGDQISIFAWTGDGTVAPATGNRVVDNSINTLAAGKWMPQPQMLWKNTTDPHYFIGVYPVLTDPVADLTQVPYTLDVNDEAKSDMLVAVNNRGIVSTYDPVLLTFDHVMSRLIVNLQFRNQWGGIPAVEKLTVKNAAIKATINCLTKITTATADPRQDIIIPATTANEKYASVMVPQTGIRSIAITIDGKDYIFTHTDDIRLEEGKYTTISLIVGRDSIALGSVSINDWTEGTTISGGEAQTN